MKNILKVIFHFIKFLYLNSKGHQCVQVCMDKASDKTETVDETLPGP